MIRKVTKLKKFFIRYYLDDVLTYYWFAVRLLRCSAAFRHIHKN